MIALLAICHLCGDFLLQNHWMQRKSQSSWVCTVHVAFYSLPFSLVARSGDLPLWAFWLILIQHWLQDRYALHLKWMTLYGQTPPDKWPVGPLCVDQAMHLTFIGIVGFLIETL